MKMPTEKTGEFFMDPLRQASLEERWWLRFLKGHEDIFTIYDPAPTERVLVEGLRYSRDPLLGAIKTRALERAETSAQLVTQGTLAYVHADDVPYRVERYIPIDIYLEETDVASLVELNDAIRDLFETLGFEYINYPAIATSSTHARGALKTRQLTPEELEKVERLIAKGLQDLNGNNGGGHPAKDNNLEAHKALLELAKLQAEIRLSEQEIKKSEAETRKADAERGAAVMDKRNKLASLWLKGTGIIALTIGALFVGSGPANHPNAPVDQPKAEQIIRANPVERASHLRQFGEFLTKLAEQDKSGEK